MTVLQTMRMNLRPCLPIDREDFIELERDREVMRFLNGGRAVDDVTGDPDAPFLMPRGTEPHVWTGRRKSNDAFVGWFCLWPESATLAELGYRLRQADWGQGLASEGAAALIDWGFKSGGYDRIFAVTMAVHYASRRVMEKAGLKHIRKEQFDRPDPFSGGEHGEVWYELTRSAWNER